MKNKKRMASVILAAIILLALVTSLFVITHNADHDCISENCPVCAVIELCRSTLKILGSIFIAAAAIFACFRFAASLISLPPAETHCETLISLKVKLLN